MKSGAVVLGTLVSVLLLAVAGMLYLVAGATGESHYRSAISLVRQIQQLSSNWSVEIARVKSDPFADFDSLAAFIPRMARLKDRLAETNRQITDLPDRLASDLAVYRNAVDAQEERIERFKTGYAVVRNSTRYFPLAAANAQTQAGAAGDEDLGRTLAAFVQGMNAYVAAPSAAEKERLVPMCDAIRAASVAYPPALANPLANLADHATVLIERIEPTEDLFRGATSNEIAELTDRLVRNLELELGRKQVRAGWYERGMMLTVGLLVVFWIGLALQQRARGGGVVAAAAVPAAGAAAVPMAGGVAAAAAAEPPAREVAAAAPAASPPTFLERAAAESAEAAALAAPAPEEPPPAAAPEEEEEDEDEPFPDALVFAGEAESMPEPMAAPGSEGASDAALLNAFLIECTAENLAASTARASDAIDRLRAAQTRIRAALQDSDALLDAPDGTDVEEEMEAASAVALHVRREVNAIADVARRLASFESLPNGQADHALVDVNACIEEAIEAAGAEDVATVATKLGKMPELFASKTDLRLMFAEVIGNSVHAFDGLEDRSATIKIDSARKNDEILITIIDNGAGMTPDRRARIFTPFYTTREGAVGLGLTFAGHLAKKYEGSIKVNSLPGQGTVTRIVLPAGPSAS